MEPARSIGRLGFRRWYEHQLYECFAWLMTCLLAAFLFAAIVEIVGLHTPALTLLATLAALYGVGLLGFSAWRRFIAQLVQAQRLASRSTCGQCNTYGRFDVLTDSARMNVRCRKCANEWWIG